MLRDEKYRILTLQDKTTSIFALSDGDGDLSDPIWLFLSFSLILALSLALSLAPSSWLSHALIS